MICNTVGLGLRKNIVFVPSLDIRGARKWDVLIVSDDSTDIDSNLKKLYLSIYSFVNGLYDLSVHLDELWEFTQELDGFQENILRKINEYIRLSSWHVLTKNKLMSDIEKMCVEIFSRYTEFVKSNAVYARAKRSALQGALTRSEIIDLFQDDLVERYETPSFNEQLFHSTLDEAEEVFGRYSLNRSNIIAGAIGGTIVFILSQIITYLASLQ